MRLDSFASILYNCCMKKFDLSTPHGRYMARKHGLDVPKLKPGKPGKDFWSQVQKTDDCWLWVGEFNRGGYGVYRALGRAIRAHRYVLEHILGNDISDKVVMHICDNTRCCNPAHLVVGTHADNVKDKVTKGRQATGERNGQSKLTEQSVLEIRKKYSTKEFTYKKLGAEYGVCEDTIKKAVKGIYWGHVQ